MVDDVVGSFIEAEIVLVFTCIVIVVENGYLSNNYRTGCRQYALLN